MAQTYKYIDKTGKEAFVDAGSVDEALKIAPNKDPNSGVQAWSRVTPGQTLPSTLTNSTPDKTTNLLNDFRTSQTQTTPESTAMGEYKRILTSAPVAPDESQIKEQKRLQAQALVNEINAMYAPKFAQSSDEARKREKRAQALSINAGLQGSDFASARASEAEAVGAKDRAMLESERSAKVMEVISGIEDRASSEYATKRAQYLKEIEGNYNLLSEFQKKQSDTARNNAMTLASQGISLDTLKTKAPDVYDTLIKESGLQPAIFNSYYNSQLPENLKRIYKYKTVGNQMYAISYNPQTKKIESELISTPGGFDKFVMTPDGTPLFINTATGKAQIASGFSEGQFVKGMTSKGTNASDITSALNDAYAAINAGANPDEVRRAFLQDFPNKASQFNAYVKTSTGRSI